MSTLVLLHSAQKYSASFLFVSSVFLLEAFPSNSLTFSCCWLRSGGSRYICNRQCIVCRHHHLPRAQDATTLTYLRSSIKWEFRSCRLWFSEECQTL
ncbi:uncharacterized protein BCR38DRAFT_424788 [Pseudomassariella vexata]|uniref:Uncharacterized protein n=1 Tax=Pseudomassariella vexata TaxID=1141098 RepID=A0A1Y2EBZ6_9PEZI|nr:uncharacterized protein BCR38DRAFT_424788 [Pseudomassariella vexata]ORY68937.1 hypothetical protein BCR38DRAFT_424788 [Pseudomassariella vexata]